jgi:hypothetical protein
VIAALLLACLAQEGYDAAMRRLEVRDFVGALALLEGERNGLLAARGRSAVFFRARDFAHVLRETAAGLGAHPADEVLLQRRAAAFLWLGDGLRALRVVARLESALDAPDPTWSPEDLRSWQSTAAELRVEAEQRCQRVALAQRAIVRARSVAIGVMAAALAAFLAVARQGRSSAPPPNIGSTRAVTGVS